MSNLVKQTEEVLMPYLVYDDGIKTVYQFPLDFAFDFNKKELRKVYKTMDLEFWSSRNYQRLTLVKKD